MDNLLTIQPPDELLQYYSLMEFLIAFTYHDMILLFCPVTVNSIMQTAVNLIMFIDRGVCTDVQEGTESYSQVGTRGKEEAEGREAVINER